MRYYWIVKAPTADKPHIVTKRESHGLEDVRFWTACGQILSTRTGSRYAAPTEDVCGLCAQRTDY